MGKFKVGDKVRVRNWDDMAKDFGVSVGWSGTEINIGPNFTESMKEYCGKVITITGINSAGYYTIDEDVWKFSDEMLEPVTNNIIVIYEKDNKVIALDKGTGKTAEAICNPEDKFDFYVGADLAYERLRGRQPAPKTREEAPKYFTGEIVCVKAESEWYTLGKIYKVKDGRFADNDGDLCMNRFKSVNEINKHYDSQFIEVIK